MVQLRALIYRNTKLFFKDKGMFFTAMITPMILLVLYASFLGNLFKETFTNAIPAGIVVSEKVIDGCVAGQLLSSLLTVSCVTVSFCCNLLMVQDKALGTRHDLTIAPLKNSTLALSYYFATLISSMIICLAATAVGLIYVAFVGWYLSFADVMLLVLDVFLLVMFGTALSSVIGFFLSTQGQISAVGSIISSVYGFICGAYMPIGQFSKGLQDVISCLPGTYGTVLLRNHCMHGAFEKFVEAGIPSEFVDGMKQSVDCAISFFGHEVSTLAMYLILGGTVAVLMLVYILQNKKEAPAR